MTDNIFLMINVGEWILQLCRHLKVHSTGVYIDREKVLQQGESSRQWPHNLY